jgi:hypothetical protein
MPETVKANSGVTSTPTNTLEVSVEVSWLNGCAESSGEDQIMLDPQRTRTSTFTGLPVAVFDQNALCDLGKGDRVVGVFGFCIVDEKTPADPLDSFGWSDGTDVEVDVRPT